MEFSKRLLGFGAEIFASLNEKKLELEKEGRQIYNLSIGTPDFEPAEHIRTALIESAKHPEDWKYALRDLPELLDAVCAYYKRRFQVEILPEQIMSCYGTQEGMGHLALALLDPGDLVLLPDPCYPVFQAGVFMAQAEPWYYPLVKENDFLPDVSAIPEEISRRAKLMVVNLPANPVGSVAAPETYGRLVEWAKTYDVLIVHDNAYSDIIFDGNEGRSFFNTPGAADVGVEFFSLSKSFNVTGARISFLIGRKDVVDAVKLLRSQIDFGMFIPIQKAAAAALNGPLEPVKAQCEEYQKRRDALCKGARSLGWEIPDARGSMFVWAPIPESYSSSMDFCMDLLSRAGVLCTPGSSFGPHGEGYVRFALVLPPEKIQEALLQIQKSGLLEKQ